MFKKLIVAIALIIGVSAVSIGTSSEPALAKKATSAEQSGTFEGRSDHITTGGVSVVKLSTGYVVILESNFSLDGAPAPTIGFGKDGAYDKAAEFSKLTSKDGLQVYAVPANINPADFNEFYIWCSQFDVPLGVAALK